MSDNGAQIMEKVLDSPVGGIQDFSLDDFEPMPGIVIADQFQDKDTIGDAGVILLPEKCRRRQNIAVVEKAHASAAHFANPIRPGDIVAFATHAGQPFPIGGKPSRVLLVYNGEPHDDIIGVIPKEKLTSATGV